MYMYMCMCVHCGQLQSMFQFLMFSCISVVILDVLVCVCVYLEASVYRHKACIVLLV